MKAEKNALPLVAGGKRWRKISTPRPWNPAIGEVLQGRLLSRCVKPGDGGSSYGVATIGTDDGQAYKVSGVVITGLFDAAGDIGDASIRIVFLGAEVSQSTGRTWKNFELYVEETLVTPGAT